MASEVHMAGKALRAHSRSRNKNPVAPRLVLAVVLLVLAYGVPLLGRYEMLRSPTLWVALSGAAAFLLSQPAVSRHDLRGRLSAELCSAWFVLMADIVAVVTPVVEWRLRGFPGAADLAGPLQLAGTGLLASGLALRALSIRLPRLPRGQRGKLLSTWSPYRLVRHPDALGGLVAVLGQALVLGSIVGAGLGFAAMMGAYAYRIELEERKLLQTFGPQYAEYKERTSALVPFIW